MRLRLSRALSLLGRSAAAAVLMALPVLGAREAAAFSIELKDVAPDRVDRQRAHGYGLLPLPGTPDLARLDERLALKGLTLGSPIYVRIYKVESELELWMLKGDQFVLLDTYPICHWSGTLGPKQREGDAQAPEGVYTVSQRQMRLRGRWQKAFNLGFPNPLDQIHSRTGSFILVHGGCSSVGCFAMTNPVIDEIYRIARAALSGPQERFHVHVFPFRMTAANMARYHDPEWREFWTNLKEVHDTFERTHRLPRIGICEQRYLVDEGRPGEFGNENPYRVFGRCVTSIVAQGPAVGDDGGDAPIADAAAPAMAAPAPAPSVLSKAMAPLDLPLAGPPPAPAKAAAKAPEAGPSAAAAVLPSRRPVAHVKQAAPVAAPAPPPKSTPHVPAKARAASRADDEPARPVRVRSVPRAKSHSQGQAQGTAAPADASAVLGTQRGG